MQNSLFPSFIQTAYNNKPDNTLFTNVDSQRLAIERSEYSKWYCIKVILYEQYLWDMRCWHKPKYQYTKAEVMEHIKKWISDHDNDQWTYNCGHCLYCIRKLLHDRACTLEEIAGYCLRNNFIKYPNQINTWDKDIDESGDDIEQASDSSISI